MELEKPNRRTVLKGIGAGALASTGMAGVVSADQPAPNTPPIFTPPPRGQLWGSDGTDEWEFIDTGFRPAPGGHAPFYEIPKLDGCHSPHSPEFFLPAKFDIVAATPGKKGGREFNANWHVHAVLDPTAEGIQRADPEDLPENPTPQGIRDAAADEEDVMIVPICWDTDTDPPTGVPCFSPLADEPLIFTCSVHPKDCPD